MVEFTDDAKKLFKALAKAAMKDAAKQMGAKGGKTAAARMTPQQRTERARKAIQTRWNKMKENSVARDR